MKIDNTRALGAEVVLYDRAGEDRAAIGAALAEERGLTLIKFDSLFAALDKIDSHLATHRYLVGNTITEADWRLFTTLIRFPLLHR